MWSRKPCNWECCILQEEAPFSLAQLRSLKKFVNRLARTCLYLSYLGVDQRTDGHMIQAYRPQN
jgi:hypothetical protein